MYSNSILRIRYSCSREASFFDFDRVVMSFDSSVSFLSSSPSSSAASSSAVLKLEVAPRVIIRTRRSDHMSGVGLPLRSCSLTSAVLCSSACSCPRRCTRWRHESTRRARCCCDIGRDRGSLKVLRPSSSVPDSYQDISKNVSKVGKAKKSSPNQD
jgi:hypothetical protein